MHTAEFYDGIAICGDISYVDLPYGPFPLIIADPPYGNIVDDDWDRIKDTQHEFVNTMFGWVTRLSHHMMPGAALYWWGGIGKPGFRPFYEFASEIEFDRTLGLEIAAHITWRKRRAYGVQNNYLFTREECLYLVKGDAKKPRKFNIPLLDEKRGYAGYNAKYPAKSEYLRRGMVWDDITELFRGKVHPTQKPERLAEVMIETHTEPGEWVLDPFAGSGSTALAARAKGRRFVVVERDPEIFDAMVRRIGGGW